MLAVLRTIPSKGFIWSPLASFHFGVDGHIEQEKQEWVGSLPSCRAVLCCPGALVFLLAPVTGDPLSAYQTLTTYESEALSTVAVNTTWLVASSLWSFIVLQNLSHFVASVHLVVYKQTLTLQHCFGRNVRRAVVFYSKSSPHWSA